LPRWLDDWLPNPIHFLQRNHLSMQTYQCFRLQLFVSKFKFSWQTQLFYCANAIY
jgi:hypothetical protein